MSIYEYAGNPHVHTPYSDGEALLVGEEVHDVRRQSQANHLLAYNADVELAPLASDPQELIDQVNQRGGFGYLAHSFEKASPLSPDLDAIPWVDWEVEGYAGLEVWNYMCINTHILTARPLNGGLEHDKELVYEPLRAGRTWVGYDLLAPTRGFRFHARSGDIRLVRNGQVQARTRGQQLRHTTAKPGAYRVEVYRHYRMRWRGWIFSSPIYVK